ncbi:hypothetical protein RHOSPDRAFT_35799 [Rhodotorula sp. JG-1b]|nr:hypothetical protein RHOSPDRAFT_35799 [Rhodotorula sp. JG-1b]
MASSFHHSALVPVARARHKFFTEFIGAEEHTAKARQSFLDFLRKIDDYLQELTLGISKQKREQPDLTTHEYRELENYHLGEGSATACPGSSLCSNPA